jgi:hypothetical protein
MSTSKAEQLSAKDVLISFKSILQDLLLKSKTSLRHPIMDQGKDLEKEIKIQMVMIMVTIAVAMIMIKLERTMMMMVTVTTKMVMIKEMINLVANKKLYASTVSKKKAYKLI